MPSRLDPQEEHRRDQFTQAIVTQLQARGVLPDPLEYLSWDLGYGRYTWNVSQALELVAHVPHRLRPTPLHHLAFTARMATVQAAHVQHADPTRPGIVAMLFNLEVAHWEAIIIDGNHRAVRAYQVGQPFQCYELTPIESWALLLEHPTQGEAVFYADHLRCPPGCMIQMDADAPAAAQERA